MLKKNINRKGQVMIFIGLVAVFVFLLAFTLFFDYLLLSPGVSGEEYRFIQQENSRLADALLLPGYPESWNKESVMRIGLAENNFLNETKAGYFQELTENDEGYETGRSLLGLFYDYLVIIEDAEGNTIHSIGNYERIPNTNGFITEEDLKSTNPSAIAIQERTILRETNGVSNVKIKVYTYQR